MKSIWYNTHLKSKYYSFMHKSSLISNSIIHLCQSDFNQGTYRIVKPGYYQFSENIIFHPNPENEFNPTEEQFNQQLYSRKHYRLGFFAAITVESDDVVIDLNGFKLSQSIEHYHIQRFYAHIELASTPFIPNTGPANFGEDIIVPNNVIIKNGCLGLSSHHGCHGNNMSKILFHNLTFKDYEVAAISLNAGTYIYVKDITITNSHQQVHALAMMSHFIFDLPFLKKIAQINPNATITMNHKIITIQEIIKDIQHELNTFRNDPKKYNGIFSNKSKLPDSNIYGIVFNSKGPVIGPFKNIRNENTHGNEYIYIENVKIYNIVSDSIEINNFGPTPTTTLSYGKGQMVGPVGDVIPFDTCLNSDGIFIGNVLTHMQLIINKYGKTKKEKGTANVSSLFISDLEKGKEPFSILLEKHGLYCIKGKDTMAHTMKGNIGIFISQGKKIYLNDITIDGVINNGTSINSESSESSGIVVSGTTDIIITNTKISNIHSNTNNEMAIREKNQNKNIILL